MIGKKVASSDSFRNKILLSHMSLKIISIIKPPIKKEDLRFLEKTISKFLPSQIRNIDLNNQFRILLMLG